MRVLKGILGQLSFFTVIPAGRVDFDLVMEFAFLSPLVVGLVTGVIDYLVVLSLYPVMGRLAWVLLIPVVEVVRGFNHLDGLLDFGDALMIRGTQEERKRALKDVSVGAGGIGLLLVYLTIFYVATQVMGGTGLQTLYQLISAEVLSRVVGLLSLALSNPMEGSTLGRMFHEKLKGKWVALLIESVPFLSLCSAVLMTVLMLLFIYAGKRVLGGSSGDLTGAAITLSFPIILIGEIKCSLFSLPHLL
ncbi:Adenosylcobinamide-GDP ribazoletransferase [Metallosphaera sp. J1]|uniref:adenosylcobinamide-GDP ribazoletransferase n=1 Tax=Metallosphaera TaxID=41980 RepID=UPI001EDE9547|nr:adenosylcobinamide-GDP ribazoletransferase [Metallosphaera javensis (ex Hofmann et al. 2022)]MCG3109390.1 Adenosylcobinamide-GDP ribazoletransferase [Metallosphaera javensis (ex Hofmann et al. 2022)]BCS92176.1 MAG: adenosylcobinamide-GDP ribazoletransferase [Metallosphaera javensis (ex Sakai et al. 2022)]